MPQYRILYVARTARGGSAFSLYHLVSGLDRSRYEPVVLFYTQEHPYIGNRLAESGVKTITLKKQQRQEASLASARPVRRRDIASWLEARLGKRVGQLYVSLKDFCQSACQDVPKIYPIVRAVRECKADLVHLNAGLRGSRAGIIASWLTGTPCLCHARMFKKLEFLDTKFARFVDQFIYISRAVEENHVAQGVPATKGTIVYNAIDLNEFSTDGNAASVRREFGWNDQDHVVGVVGRLDWWKGHEYFLEAMAEVAKRFPDLRGLIVGEPEKTLLNREYYRKLQSLTRSLDLEDRIVFTGFRADVPRIMSALDVVVLSSSTPEPFGRVVIEGMAAGKPVVATGAGGVMEIITDGLDGLLVPCKDSKAMAQAILWLLSNPERAKSIGRAARRRVAQQFTVEHHVARMQSIYDSVLEANGVDEHARNTRSLSASS